MLNASEFVHLCVAIEGPKAFSFSNSNTLFGANVRRQDQFVGENEVKRKEERN